MHSHPNGRGELAPVQDELLRFICDEIAARHGISSVAPDEDLIKRGIVDSLGIQEVVAFCESRYAIQVESAELLPENFQTVEQLAAYVERKRRAASTARPRRSRLRFG